MWQRLKKNILTILNRPGAEELAFAWSIKKPFLK
jgi:hypothetical protein